MAEKLERWSSNGVKGCKERRDPPKGTGTRGYDKNCTRQTTITNSTPPVEDNYRASREATRVGAVAHEGVVVEDRLYTNAVADDAPPFMQQVETRRCSLFNLLTQIDSLILFSDNF